MAERFPALKPERIDDVGQAMLVLAQELWAMKDRQFALEQALAATGVDIEAAVDRFAPNEAQTEALAAERKRYITRIIEALNE